LIFVNKKIKELENTFQLFYKIYNFSKNSSISLSSLAFCSSLKLKTPVWKASAGNTNPTFSSNKLSPIRVNKPVISLITREASDFPATPLTATNFPLTNSGAPKLPFTTGLEIQSKKFFKGPGTEPLYSGVTIQSASVFLTSLRTFTTSLGVGNSISWLIKGNLE